jgi:hypothetical protein
VTGARRIVIGVPAAVAAIVAAEGWLYLVRATPGPRVPLALPLEEAGGGDGVSAVAFVAVWSLAALAVCALVGIRRGWLAPVVAAIAVTGGVLVLHAMSLQLVQQATIGFAWRPALDSLAPWLAGASAGVAVAIGARVGPRHREALQP